MEEQPKDDNTLRHDQLQIRLVEMEATLAVIRKLTHGDLCATQIAKGCLQASRTYDWKPWVNAVDVTEGNVCYVGHSFGGTAVLAAAAAHERFNPSAIIVMDPAMERE